MVVAAMALLLMASLAVMLYYARKEVKEDALQKASNTLETVVQRIDNIMLSVEQTAGNIYLGLHHHINNPEMVDLFCRHTVEANPYISGCAIAFKKDFYQGREYFMVYYHRNGKDTKSNQSDNIVKLESYGDNHYSEQSWFTTPMTTGRSGWMNPQDGMSARLAPIITFCLPIYGSDGRLVGTIGFDVSLNLLTQVILDAKPSVNSYCTLLSGDGTFLVHPDERKLYYETVFTQSERGADPSVRAAAEAMVSGDTGYKPFRLNGNDYYVFYKPFTRLVLPGRSMEKLDWSAGIIYPESDIFGDYISLSYTVIAISVVGLMLLFFLSRSMIHRQLKPLVILTESAQLIAKGNYDIHIPDSWQKDEVGRLQDNFKQMQQSLATSIGELEQLTTKLKQHGEELRVAYNNAQKADRMKTAFLHNMTNQMIAPADAIDEDVNELCDFGRSAGNRNPVELANDIQRNGSTIAILLKNLISISDEDMVREKLESEVSGGNDAQPQDAIGKEVIL